MFITDAMAGRPPVRHIGLNAIALRHQNVAEPLPVFRVVPVVVFEPVHVLKIKANGAFAPVDFDLNVIAPPQRIARGFQIGHHATGQPANEHRRVLAVGILLFFKELSCKFISQKFIRNFSFACHNRNFNCFCRVVKVDKFNWSLFSVYNREKIEFKS